MTTLNLMAIWLGFVISLLAFLATISSIGVYKTLSQTIYVLFVCSLVFISVLINGLSLAKYYGFI